MMRWFICCVSLALAMAAFSWTTSVLANDEPLATQAVQILKSKCFSCHGAEEKEGGLRLDSREALMKGGERGAAAVAGQADKSLLFQCVAGLTDEELRMPPRIHSAPLRSMC